MMAPCKCIDYPATSCKLRYISTRDLRLNCREWKNMEIDLHNCTENVSQNEKVPSRIVCLNIFILTNPINPAVVFRLPTIATV